MSLFTIAYTRYDDEQGEDVTVDEVVDASDAKEAIEILCSEAGIKADAVTEVSWIAPGVVRRGSNRKRGS